MICLAQRKRFFFEKCLNTSRLKTVKLKSQLWTRHKCFVNKKKMSTALKFRWKVFNLNPFDSYEAEHIITLQVLTKFEFFEIFRMNLILARFCVRVNLQIICPMSIYVENKSVETKQESNNCKNWIYCLSTVFNSSLFVQRNKVNSISKME